MKLLLLHFVFHLFPYYIIKFHHLQPIHKALLLEGFKNISEALKDVKVFADTAFESSLTLDKEKNPDILTFKINFDTNLYKLLNALKTLTPEIETSNLTEQNSGLKLSLLFTVDFDNINKGMIT